ncbi:MAG: hypothetical protein QE278_13535 [Limnobacter sp.]|nr:hypothetical protein [Limnobacter sp.]
MRSQKGMGLVSAMIGVFLSLTMGAIAISLLGRAMQGPTGGELDNTTDSLRKHIQLWREIALGTGANPNGTPGIETIKVCQLTGNPAKCAPYTGGTTGQCFVYLSQNLPFKGTDLLIRALKLTNGQLHYYAGQNTNTSWNDHRQLCEQTTGWAALNDTNVYQIQAMRVCAADVSSANRANLNYDNQCVSVLDTTGIKNRMWLVMFDTIQTKPPQITDRLHGWLGFQNSTRVESIQ